MELETWTTLLIAIAPAVSAVVAIISGCLAVIRKFKKVTDNANERAKEANEKLLKAYKDLATLKTKVESIEKYLVEQKEKKK